MNLIRISTNFLRNAKKLKKKFLSLRGELDDLFQELSENPQLGTHLGDNIYKIRLASESKGKGKSGGFRVVTYLVDITQEDTKVYLITIYDKSEIASISKNDLKSIIDGVLEEENNDLIF